MLKELAYQIARRKVGLSAGTPAGEEQALASSHEYSQWRQRTLRQEYLQHFDAEMVAGKDVLDFGCGDGALSFVVAGLGAKSCTGIDLGRKSIERAKEKVTNEPVSFQCADDPKEVPLHSEAFDVIVCFDVVEHIMEYEAIISEWYRILRCGGRVLIHWQPWFHPHGHHGYTYIPIPWVHVFLSNRQRTEICARIVELPDFDAPFWDRDQDGHRINRFRQALEAGQADDDGFLNQLTIRKFERLVRQAGFHLEKRKYTHFQGSWPVRAVSATCTRVPFLREFFTANAIYVLAKPDDPQVVTA